MKKLGIYGGMFNPPHNRHMEIIRYSLDNIVDDIMIVPSVKPHYKKYDGKMDRHRFTMISIALQENFTDRDKRISICNYEMKYGQSYTINTVKYIKKSTNYGKYYLIIGADQLRDFYTWKDYEDLLDEITLVVFSRDNIYIKEIDFDYIFYQLKSENISSTLIRNKIAREEDIKDMVPLSIYKYIKNNNLYRKAN